ncbi:MAG TPA: hypothetical protein DD473_06390 [Planctomycetaceae bacterium]|nr:hypothetical protein [Planctomycetaceae bacterium]
MKISECQCGNRIFFNNIQCLACERTIGLCDCCHSLTSFTKSSENTYTCDQKNCGEEVVFCSNRTAAICNSMILPDSTQLCHWCEFTSVHPDTSQLENIQRWAELERAKRQLLFQLEWLDFPPYLGETGVEFPLEFQFLAPQVDDAGKQIPVYTGHANGVITINLMEADRVFRERTRLELNEPQRTLIGHMRHEIGHYIDMCYLQKVAAEKYAEVFGDPNAVSYGDAKDLYYKQGAPDNWAENYVSAYATMHPMEDMAETMNVYLDLISIARTANVFHYSKIDISPRANIDKFVQDTLKVAVVVSEFNSDLGLMPLLPEQLPQSVVDKIGFIHSLRGSNSNGDSPPTRRRFFFRRKKAEPQVQ